VTVPAPHIAIIGAGGLGGPIALACSAGGARITVCDPDTIELSNLHRQVQFATADIGRPKAEVLASAIRARGGDARGVVEKFTRRTAGTIASDATVVVDASDDPATKFAVADWAVAHGVPHVIAAAIQHEGSVMIGAPGGSCYRCLFESPPTDVPTCGDAGVLGPTVGAVGGVAAAAALALTGSQAAASSTLYVFDDLRTRFTPRVVRFARRADCTTCATAP
jgi:molybdopterin/thiamine biosynthesis adenylyltransferase